MPIPFSISVNTDVAASATALPEEDESMGSERPSSEGDDMAEFISSSKEADTTVLPTDTDEVPDTGYSVFGGTASVMQSQKTKQNGKALSPIHAAPLRLLPFLCANWLKTVNAALPQVRSTLGKTRVTASRQSTRTRWWASTPHTTRASQVVKGVRLSQSIPGLLINKDEEHDKETAKEEEDDIAPLPPS